VALSFHATKSFGVGEGGAVVTTDQDLAGRVFQSLNFGFVESRETAIASTNGKMSEYSAAVGLAELDGWGLKRAMFASVHLSYKSAFAAQGIRNRLWGHPDVGSCYVLLECSTASQAEQVVHQLATDGIDSRLWYGRGLSSHRGFRSSLGIDLHGEHKLDPRTLVGLPMAVDLRNPEVSCVAESVGRALKS
jgi:dTDP-4-amino-4,6-dideoxygalactose transaminase